MGGWKNRAGAELHSFVFGKCVGHQAAIVIHHALAAKQIGFLAVADAAYIEIVALAVFRFPADDGTGDIAFVAFGIAEMQLQMLLHGPAIANIGPFE